MPKINRINVEGILKTRAVLDPTENIRRKIRSTITKMLKFDKHANYGVTILIADVAITL